MTKKAAPKNDNIEPLDVLMGKRMRFRRNLLGMTQVKLAEELGISFQQVQKYEKGQNKIYASRLFDIAQVLKTPITYFFEEEGRKVAPGMSDLGQDDFTFDNPLEKSETTTLIRSYYDIEDKKKRKTLIEMMKNLKTS